MRFLYRTVEHNQRMSDLKKKPSIDSEQNSAVTLRRLEEKLLTSNTNFIYYILYDSMIVAIEACLKYDTNFVADSMASLSLKTRENVATLILGIEAVFIFNKKIWLAHSLSLTFSFLRRPRQIPRYTSTSGDRTTRKTASTMGHIQPMDALIFCLFEAKFATIDV